MAGVAAVAALFFWIKEMLVPNQRSSRRRRLVGGLAIAVVIIAIALVGLTVAVGSPTVPAGSAATSVAVLKNATAGGFADVTGDTAYDREPLVRRACLDPVVRAAGSLQLCWTVGRLMTENDPAHDEYILRVIGTLHGEALPSGPRWAVVRAGPNETSAPFQIEGAWPGTSVFEGGCRDVPMELGLLGAETDPVCGRTTGEVDPSAPRTSGFRWTCAGCLLPMSGDRAVLLVVKVAVDEGKTPVWDLYADLGT